MSTDTRRLNRRGFLGLTLAAPLAFAACAPAAPPTPTIPLRDPGGWTPILPSSDLAVGPGRFTYAVLDERNRPILDAAVHLRFFDLGTSDEASAFAADAPFRGYGLGERGVYVARVTFPRAGAWGVEARLARPSGPEKVLRSRFEVRETSRTPAIGTAAPPSRQALMAGAPEPRLICTRQPACPLHNLTIADAIARGQPTVVVFATPAFCTSAVCGPGLEAALGLMPRYDDRVQFVHIEIYANLELTAAHPTVLEWGLPSEPWVFLIDRQGRVADKLEGGITPDELVEAIERIA